MSHVHVILPGHIDDPGNPSGGNVYDRRVCDGLAALGWRVREHAAPGGWPRPQPADRAALARILAGLPDQAVVLIDGLVGSVAPDVLAPHARRLHLVVVMHMPLADPTEARALALAAAVVTPSEGCARRLLELYPLPAARIHVAPPGVDPAPLTVPSTAGDRLLCVAAVTVHKGYDVLVDALAATRDLNWHFRGVGPLHREPRFVAGLRRRAERAGIADRFQLAGPRTGARLRAAYADADLLVLASRSETYGMVVTEALARGLPVLATATPDTPLVKEALGNGVGDRPGLIVPPGDPVALAGALRRWLSEPGLRTRLRANAVVRRSTLTGWSIASTLISRVLSGITANVSVDQ